MAITLNGSGTVSGISAGGLPDGIIQSADLASGVGGKILQVKSVSDTVRGSTGSFSCSQSYVDTVFTVTITPTSSSNKMLISAFFFGEGNFNEHEIQFQIERTISGGATTYIRGATPGNRHACIAIPPQGYAGFDDNSTPFNMAFNGLLDSPATTSAITYTLQCRAATGSRTVYYNRTTQDLDQAGYERGLSWLTVMEVSA